MKRPTESTVRMLSRIACVAFSLAALIWIFRRVEVQGVGRVLLGANLGWMAAACGAFGLALFTAAARWHVVLRIAQCQVDASATARTVLAGHLFNTILFGPTGGDLAKAAFYGRQFGFPTGPILASCVLDRFLGGIGFTLFAASMPGFAAYGGRWWDRLRVPTEYSLAAVIGAVAILVLAGLILRRRFNWLPAMRSFSDSFLSNVKALLRSPALAGRGLLFSVLSHLCGSCVFLFCLNAVTDVRFSLVSIFWIFPVIAMITSAPVTFAGAGLREGAALFFLSRYGIPEADAVAASMLVLVTYLIWAGIGGVVFWREGSRIGRQAVREPKTLPVVLPPLNEGEEV